MDDEEVQALVVDNGSGMCKVNNNIGDFKKIVFHQKMMRRLDLLAMMHHELCSLPSLVAQSTPESWWAWTRRTRMWVMRLSPSVVCSP